MVMANIRIRMRRTSKKIITKRYDVEKLNDDQVKTIYAGQIKKEAHDIFWSWYFLRQIGFSRSNVDQDQEHVQWCCPRSAGLQEETEISAVDIQRSTGDEWSKESTQVSQGGMWGKQTEIIITSLRGTSRKNQKSDKMSGLKGNIES